MKNARKLGIYPTKEKHHWWKGGRSNSGDGHIKIQVLGHPHADKHGYIAEHRVIMEQRIGRYLSSDEIVHHLNGIKHDNRLANLVVVKARSHASWTYVKALQKRIRELEAKITQQKF